MPLLQGGSLGHIDISKPPNRRVESSPARLAFTRRRVRLLTTLIFTVIAPWMIRVIFLSGHLTDPATLNVAMANVAAVAIAFWTRLSVESYPGIRRAYLILLSVFVAHGCTLLWFLLTRYP